MDKIYKLSAFKNELAKYPSFNDCLMFQPGLLFIDTFFGGSLDLSKYSNQVEKIGANSANGFIRKLTYVDNINMSVILKSNKSVQNDNLYYEYLAGQCINEFSKFYPFFSRTYGVGKYVSDASFNTFFSMTSGINVLGSPLGNFIQYLDQSDFENLVSESCINSRRINVFTQYIPIYKSLNDYFYAFLRVDKKTFEPSHQRQLTKHISLLFLVYGCLHKLSNYFTHYDLHMDNIVLYPIPGGQYVDVEVKTENGIISFKTKYLPILIDYGRSYFNCSAIEAGLVNSEKIMKNVCSKDQRRSNVCPAKCGDEVGYAFAGDYLPTTDSFRLTGNDEYYINRSRRNMSHDLRGLSDIKHLRFNLLDSSIPYILRWKQMLANIDYEAYIEKYGMPETASNLAEINNVSDVFHALNEMMTEQTFIDDHNYHFNSLTQYGRLVLDFSQATMQPFQFFKSS